MASLCGADCEHCAFKLTCKGCSETCGSPFGGRCAAAEYIRVGGLASYQAFKQQLIREFNALDVPGMPEITELFQLNGSYVNLEYPMPNGEKVKLLKDEDIYLGNQVECLFSEAGEGRCYGLIGSTGFLLVAEYGCNGADPEIVIFKRR